MTSVGRLLAASTLALSLCGCHLIFPFALPSPGDAAADSASRDQGQDHPLTDGALPDGWPGDALPPGAKYVTYPDRKLSPGVLSTHFDEVWDLTACPGLRQQIGCDLLLRCTLDLSGITSTTSYSPMWTEVGLRQRGAVDFNPSTSKVHPGGQGVWLLAWADNLTSDPSALNVNDYLVAQTVADYGESYYDIRDCAAPKIGVRAGTMKSFGFRFDRDDADAGHKAHPLAAKGQSYATGGVYKARLCFRAFTNTSGSVCHKVNGLAPGLYVQATQGTMPDFYPAGLSFTGKMTEMQVFVGYLPEIGTGQVEVRDLSVVGCPAVGS